MMDFDIYVDEAGDLGFQKDSSKFFVISFVMISRNSVLKTNSEVNSLLAEMKKKHKRRYRSEFKFSKDDNSTRKSFLDKIKKLPVHFGILVFDKSNLSKIMTDGRRHLYQNIFDIFPLEEFIELKFKKNHQNNLFLIFDNLLTKGKKEIFNSLIKKRLHYYMLNHDLNLKVRILHKDSKNTPLLQMADYLAGSTFLSLEKKDNTYLYVIKSKVILEKFVSEITI